jgi:hypothetical protein
MKNPIRNYRVFLCPEESTGHTQGFPARRALLNRLGSAEQREEAGVKRLSEKAHIKRKKNPANRQDFSTS